MKPDNIINPVGPGSDELVPSRYALRIGDIEVLVISDGVLPLPTETMSTNVDPAAREKWFKDMFLGPDAFDWALNVLVVRSGDQTILIDAGISNINDLASLTPEQVMTRYKQQADTQGSSAPRLALTQVEQWIKTARSYTGTPDPTVRKDDLPQIHHAQG